MIKLILVKNSGESDITQLVEKVTWSGEYTQVSRKLNFTLVSSTTDYYLTKVEVNMGDLVKFYYNNSLLFIGYIFNRSKSHKSSTMEFTAYDKAIYLTKNECSYNFKNATAENITKKICNDFSIPIGSLSTTGITQNLVVMDGTLYDTIMKAYTKASEQNGLKYLPMMMNNSLSVIERGDLVSDYILQNGINLTNSEYSESIENMVNTVQIIDDKGKVIETVSNTDFIKAFGKMQKVYKKEDNVNYKEVAKNMLTDVECKGSIEALGNTTCITGYAVSIEDDYTGLVGIFNIDSDTHNFENGIYTMSLQLNFDEVMDAKTYRQANKSKKGRKKKSKSNVEITIWG